MTWEGVVVTLGFLGFLCVVMYVARGIRHDNITRRHTEVTSKYVKELADVKEQAYKDHGEVMSGLAKLEEKMRLEREEGDKVLAASVAQRIAESEVRLNKMEMEVYRE